MHVFVLDNWVDENSTASKNFVAKLTQQDLTSVDAVDYVVNINIHSFSCRFPTGT
jgi:hypothetical protein